MINVEGLSEINVQKGDTMVEEKVAELKAELERLKREDKVKKNQKPGKPDPNKKYILLSKELKSWGKVPKQQAEIAQLLGQLLTVGQEYTEAEVFAALEDYACEFPSITNSVQDPTYLFRYYRGLKNDGKHAGFVARDFIRVIG
jgi:hypothetical protein